MSSNSSNKILDALCRTSRSILAQKKGLIQALCKQTTTNACANETWTRACAVVGGASLGQHIRHSLDHMEKAVGGHVVLNYDTRDRETDDEVQVAAALDRIEKIDKLLQDAKDDNDSLEASFLLGQSSTGNMTETRMATTRTREIAFAAHHAIHHMAMIRIIALSDVGKLSSEDLPADFGRAPSTVRYDQEQSR